MWVWKADLWYSLMGTDTLVDLVYQIWNVASTAVSTIKDATTKALNAVKSGLEFIQDAALKLILNGIVFILQNLMSVMVGILDSLLDLNLQISEVTNGYQIEGFNFKIYRQDINIILELGSGKLILGNMIDTAEIETETLGILNGDAQFGTNAGLIAILHTTAMYAFILSVPLLRAIGNPLVMVGTFFTQLVVQLGIFAGGTINGITDSSNDLPDREAFKTIMLFTYLSLAISSLRLMIDYKGLGSHYRTSMAFALIGGIFTSLPGVIATGDPTSNVIGGFIDETFGRAMEFIRQTPGMGGLQRDIAFVAGMHVVYYIFMFIISMFISP